MIVTKRVIMNFNQLSKIKKIIFIISNVKLTMVYRQPLIG